MTHIFHSLDSHYVNEVRRGEVKNDGVNIPGPLAQGPQRDQFQVVAHGVLAAGAQSGGVAILQLGHPSQTAAVWIGPFEVLPSAVWCSGSGWDDEHRPVLPLRPRGLLLHRVPPAAILFLHRERW